MFPTLTEDGAGGVLILDQTLLPALARQQRLTTLADAAHAIRVMQVRGAPLIGATAAYGVALGLSENATAPDDAALEQTLATLAATRPTAVNLHWALSRMRHTLEALPATRRAAAAWQEARTIAAEDAATNAAIGQHGRALLSDVARQQPIVRIMTHCNAGWLATVAHGTALAPIYAAHAAGIRLQVWVSETRPRNQGWLTAWELAQAQVPHTLLADNAAGLLMMQGKVDLVIVGADRIAANGDTANKIGTYLKALAAQAHDIPFYVAAPCSTIDLSCTDGTAIPIEERDATELGAAPGTTVVNPAFDVTPAHLIHGIITERGILSPCDLRTRAAP
jgi:methylthioribose-1-phosphate isomerase